MRESRRGWIVVAVALAIGACIALDDARAAKRPKFVAHVNGKVFKANLRPSITGAYTSIGVILNGLSQHVRIGRGSIKTLLISCGGFNLTTATFPFTVDCAGAYTDNTFKGLVPPANPKGWAAGSGLQVTFQSFDGTRVKGTFEGTLPPGDSNPTDPPANFQRGKFAMDLINSGA